MTTFKNALTEKLGIQYPIMLAGMAGISGPPLVAAVRSLYHDFTFPRISLLRLTSMNYSCFL